MWWQWTCVDMEKPSILPRPVITEYIIDIVQLIPALGYSSTVLVAHDWGGANHRKAYRAAASFS